MYKLFIGIDPGNSGAVVCINPKGKLKGFSPMPVIKNEMSLDRLSKVLESMRVITVKGKPKKVPYNRILVLLEEPANFHQKSSKATCLKQGKNYGILKGLVYGLGFSFIEVRPQRWTKKFYKGYGKKYTTKQKALMVFENQFHQSTDMFKIKGKVPGNTRLEGLVDAYLIGQYGRLFYIKGDSDE